MWILKRFLVVSTVVAVSVLCSTQVYAFEALDDTALVEALDTLIDSHPTAERTTVTLKVVDLETGEVLYNRGGGMLLIPASNLKIYTSAAALDLLGPDYRWTTEVVSAKGIKRGVSAGGLVIRGTGDPMLDTEQLAGIADTLVKDHKLKKVRGGITVETSPRWDSVPIKGPGWMWDDEPDYYNMSIRSVMLNFNTVKVEVAHGDGAAMVTLAPPSSWPVVMWGRAEGDDLSAVRITRRSFEETIRITGNPKPDAEPVSETITMHDPSLWIASVFERMLVDRGVAFQSGTGGSTGEQKPGDMHSLVTQQGKTLTEALRHFLKVSENAVGEMILLKLAETQTDGNVTWPVGAKVISEWLVNTAGLEAGSFRIVDGSGLSRYNLISADSSVKLLAFMKTHEHFEPFFDGLPVYKVELLGTEKWGGVPLAEFEAERVFAKTGGMSGVSTISGYIKTLDGRWLAFSLLGNGYIGSNKPVKGLRNLVWTELVRYRAEDAEAIIPVSP